MCGLTAQAGVRLRAKEMEMIAAHRPMWLWTNFTLRTKNQGGSVAEWLAC